MTENRHSVRLQPEALDPDDISQASDPDMRSSLVALRRAAALARKTAIETGTELVVVREGRIVRIPAETLRLQDDARQDSAP